MIGPDATDGDAGAPERRPLLRDATATVGARLLLALLVLATDVVLARLLGPAAKGRFALVLLYSQLAALLVGFGLDRASAVVSGRSAETARSATANALLWTLVAGVPATMLSLLLYGFPSAGSGGGPLYGLVPNLSGEQFLFAALALPGELLFALGLMTLLGRQRILAYNAVRLLRRALLLVLAVATAAIARLDLTAALAMNLVALGLTTAAILAGAARAGALGLVPDLRLLREELAFGSRSVLGSLAERLQFRADAFLLNLLLGPLATGLYSVATGIGEALWYIPNALGIVIFSHAVAEPRGSAPAAAGMARLTLVLALLLALPLWVVAPVLVEVAYGTAFAPAAFALRAQLPGIVCYSLVAVLSPYLIANGFPGRVTAILLCGLAVNLLLDLALIPRLGIVGAGLASSVSYAFSALLTVALFHRLSGVALRETLVLRRSDVAAAVALAGRLRVSRRPA